VQRKGRRGPAGEDERSGKKERGWEKGKDGTIEWGGRRMRTWMLIR
jgi:hypothetical protein